MFQTIEVAGVWGKKWKFNVLLKIQRAVFLNVQISSVSPHFNTVMLSHSDWLYLSVHHEKERQASHQTCLKINDKMFQKNKENHSDQ